MGLIEDFHADHRQVVDALFELRQAIAAREVRRVRTILSQADRLVGPHFKFEECYLYPSLERFLGEGYVKKLLNEHDGIFRSVWKLAKLAEKETWSDADVKSAEANLDLIYEHPIGCDGLSLWMERLGAEERDELWKQMHATRRKGTGLFDYYYERQNA